jgi:uncharacterized protein (DUF2267 family)
MTTTAFDVFKPTLQKSAEWLDQISQVFSGDRHRAYTALRVVLHELRDRLPVAQAVHLGAQHGSRLG